MLGNLVLSRNVGQRLMIGANIVVEVVRISGNKVRLAIQAPQDIAIDREEIRNAKNRREEGPNKAA